MNKNKLIFTCFLALLTFIAFAQNDNKSNKLILDSIFSKCKWNNSLPRGWKSKNSNMVKLIKKHDNAFLRITNNDISKLVGIHRIIDLPVKAEECKLTVKFRCKNLIKGKKHYNNARILFYFRDKNYKNIGSISSPQFQEDSDWKVVTRIFKVPQNAIRLSIQACLFKATGIFDIEYIKIEQIKSQKKIINSDINYKSFYGETPQPVKTVLTKFREEIILNGIWSFFPDTNPKVGYIFVPGMWNNRNLNGIGGIVSSEKAWEKIDFNKLKKATYKRSIVIPVNWKKREVVLNLDRFANSVEIYLSNKKIGSFDWPRREIIIPSTSITWGHKQELKIIVTANITPQNNKRFMNPLHFVSMPEKLSGRGILGDVILKCRPKRHLEGCFITTSVKNKKITLEVELGNINFSGPVDFTAVIKELGGKDKKTFRVKKLITVGQKKVSLTWNWDNPKLWDIKQPNLYNLFLTIKGDGIQDELLERFGFREIRVIGKELFLNGRKIRFRSTTTYNMRYIGGVRKAIENNLDAYLNYGYNLFNVVNRSFLLPGIINFSYLWADVADLKGMPIIYRMFYFANRDMLDHVMEDKQAYEKWLKFYKYEWKKVRNSPSVIMFSTAISCYTGHRDDINPRRIGKRNALEKELAWKKRAKNVKKCVQQVKKIDPSRLIVVHHGGSVGDIYAANVYLDFIPLQERAEWLSEWARNGNMPLGSWEFGTPFQCSFMRGRGGYFQAVTSEPLVTEFAAAFLGEEAYTTESDGYRAGIAKYFIKNQQYKNSLYLTSKEDNFQKIQCLFMKNDYFSWRSWGVSGGMTAWMDAYGWERFTCPSGVKAFSKYITGERGAQVKNIRNYFYYGIDKWKSLKAGKVLKSVIKPVLVWIAGKKGDFTEKQHNYYGKDIFNKQIIVINDLPVTLDLTINWEIKINDKTSKKASIKTSNLTGTTTKYPINFSLNKVDSVQNGLLKIWYTLNKREYCDSFEFKIFPREQQNDEILDDYYIYDPIGKTKKLCNGIGIKLQDWDFHEKKKVLLLGSKCFSVPKFKNFQKVFKEYIEDGGTAIIFGQKPEWYRQQGIRINRHVQRAAFPVVTQKNNLVLSGISKNDMKNWAGKGSLIPDEKYTFEEQEKQKYYGWHWSNKGSVSSAAMEKPHFSAWTPILECGFDLAYSPLMELNYRKGKIILCSLDLEDRENEPLASLLTKKIIKYASNTNNQKDVATYLIAGEKTRKIMDLAGVVYKTASEISKQNSLLIVGPHEKISDDKRKSFLEKGGKIIYLAPKRIYNGKLEESIYSKVNSISNDPIFRGLSISDMHIRGNVKFNSIKKLQGGEITANGMLGVRYVKKGIEIFFQLMPNDLAADKKTYLRFSRWRLFRALMQILANSGARFKNDYAFINSCFKSASNPVINLNGHWKLKIEKLFPQASSSNNPTHDNEPCSSAGKWASLAYNDNAWSKIYMPGIIPQSRNHDGAFWIRKEVKIPRGWKGKNLILYLGCIADCDISYFNGRKAGEIDARTNKYWMVERKYIIPSNWVKLGSKNVIAIRIFDRHNSGGIVHSIKPMSLKPMQDKKINYYYPDFRNDYDLGDDPARFHRW